MRLIKFICSVLLMTVFLSAHANEVEIVNVEFVKTGKFWRVNTTLRHDDSGWDHYADGWRVVNEAGEKLGERILFHPHEDEQPFTRSLQNLAIPEGTTIVYVEAHDKVHGWSKQRVKIDLSKSSGENYRVLK